MYRRSPQEPRYREPRYAESNEFTEESSSSSSSEEEESEKWTEESEEDTIDTRASQSFQESEGKISVSNQRSSLVFNNFEKYLINPYLATAKVSKKDKYTQKNFLSPFPSYLIEPIAREVSGPYYRVSNVMPVTEERAQRVERPSSNTQKIREPFGESYGFMKNNLNQIERKLCEKHKAQKTSRVISPEPITKHDHREYVRKSKPPVEPEISSKCVTATSPRRPKTSSQEVGCMSPKLRNCPECSAGVESRSKPKPKSAAGAASKEKEPRSQGIILSKPIGDCKTVKNRGKEVKEKLVYVVEEEGKSATKIETDLFSLNEILAIKKDLIELSEFAKKLKKLKEMKKDSESDKSKGNPCHCPPAEDLLRDVNKRIEALEARQGALEKKSRSGSIHKGDQEVDSKKSYDPKLSSTSPPKSPMMTKPSVMTTIQSFQKTDMIDPRADGFPYNSDIINELMDIRFQLEKLEKKRTSKEIPNEMAVSKETNLLKTKEHAIAVFSSKTYILTTENFDKTKEGKANGEKSRKALTKENVANWLKNISLERMDNDVSVLLRAEAKKGINPLEQKKRMDEFKCKTCTLKKENFENQEPQKNRASENQERVEKSLRYGIKDENVEETDQSKEHKESVETSSDGIFLGLSKSSKNLMKKECELQPSSLPPLPKAIQSGSSGSSGSLPSTIYIKEKLKKLKSQLSRRKHRNEITADRSKSTTSTLSKSEKTAQNQRLKDSEKVEPFSNFKKHREKKNEFVKRLEAQFLALAKNLGKVEVTSTSCSYSELVATVDFESNPSNPLPGMTNKNQVFMCSQKKDKCDSKKKKHKKKARISEKKKKHCDKAPKEKKRHEKRRHEDRKKSHKKSKKGRRCKYCLNYTCERCGHCSLCIYKCRKKRKRKHSGECSKSCECSNVSKEETRTPCNTDFSSSQVTQKESCICVKTPGGEPPYYVERPIDECGRYYDECLLKKFFKNVGGCYPKLSETRTEPSICGAESTLKLESDDVCLEPEEDSECCTCRTPTPPSSECGCHQCRRTNECKHHLRSPHCHNATELKHLDSCNCVRVFLEKRTQSNIKPFQPVKDCNKSDLSRNTTNDLFIRKINPKVYYVNHATEKHDKHEKHVKHEKHDKHDKHEKHHHHRQKREKCVCDKCGNRHRPPKKSHKSDSARESGRHKSGNDIICPPKCCEDPCHRRGDTLPLFSFFSHFCRSISRKPKSRESRKSRKSEGGMCHCSDKFQKLEKRMHDIEKDLEGKPSSHKTHKHHEEKPHKRERKKKHKEKKPKRHKEKKNLETYYVFAAQSAEETSPLLTTPPPQSTPASTISPTSKSSGHFQSLNRKINQGLNSLHSFWNNLCHYKIVNTAKIKSKLTQVDDDLLLDDVSRSSRKPRSREVHEFKAEPVSFMKKYRKNKKNKKTKKKEKLKSKSKTGKAK